MEIEMSQHTLHTLLSSSNLTEWLLKFQGSLNW